MGEDDIYQEHILDHYECPHNRGNCADCTHCHADTNPLCGDAVKVALRVEDGLIREAWFDGEGCCISQASASMLMEAIEGKPVDEVAKMSAQDMLSLLGVRLTPNRQNCCLLPWRVVQVAMHSPKSDVESPDATVSQGMSRP
jgi:nitrogen fixation NifU-like protein